MPIIDLQRRARQLGEIRIGQVVPTSNGKTRPAKLEKFRLTSPSKPLLEAVAALYGGTVQPWTPANGGAAEWEVLTDTARLPILVPPQPVSQHYELFAGSVCQRRCDGVTEQKSDQPCMCDPDKRDCSITTRLNVLLRDVPGVGVWLLTTKGWYAATELPAVAEFLAQAGGYVNAHLSMEERVVKRVAGDKTETLRFMVPTLEVDVTPAQLLAGAVSTGPAELPAPAAPAALPAGDAVPYPSDFYDLLAAATTVAEVRGIWTDAKAAGMLDGPLEAELRKRAAELEQPAGDDSQQARDRLWSQIVGASEFDTTAELERDMWAKTGATPDKATAAQLQAYLDGMGVPA